VTRGKRPARFPAVRILVVKLSSLGDILQALPTVHNLRVETGASIDWVTQPEYRSLVECFPDVDRTFCFPRRHVGALPAFVRDLRAETYDLAIDLQGLMKSALVTRMAVARRRIGPSFHREGARLLYGEVAGRRRLARHAVDQCLDIVTHLGLKRLSVEFPLRLPSPDGFGARPRIGLCPFSRWDTKNWPADRFAEAGRRILGRLGGSVTMVGGAADIAGCERIAEQIGPRARSVAGKLSLIEAVSLIGDLDLLVTNDSGPMHMAAAVGTPTVAIFGPTDPVRTGPYGRGHRILRAPMDCQPCYRRRCSAPPACMDAVTVDGVVAAAADILRPAS
jgi:heptosyltransferase-1